MVERFSSLIRDIPDFPEKGVVFKDITPILRDAALFNDVIDHLTDQFSGEGIQVVAL